MCKAISVSKANRVGKSETCQTDQVVSANLADIQEELAALRERIAQLEAIEAEHQRTETALRESEAQQRVINESAFDYAFSFRADTQGALILDWLTESFTRITGYATETLIGRTNPLRQYIHPDDLSQVTQTLQSLQAEQATEYEFRIITRDGSIKWLRSRARARLRQDGQPIRIDGATQDITERKHIEEALQQSEERFALFLDHLPGVAFIKDLEGHYLYANAALVNLWTAWFPDKELTWLGHTDDDILPPDVAARVRENDQRVISSGNGEQLTETVPHPEGPQEWLISKFPIVDPWGTPVMLGGIGINVTKKR